MSSDKPTAVFLMGPTAAGKTDLAIELVEQGGCEIISVDSAQVYRDMDIGTAKPDAETLRRAPHHLIDLLDPAESYSAVQFRQDALAKMAEITAQGRIPLLTGGTMLYFKSLVEPMSDLPPGDDRVRAELQSQLQEQGLTGLLDELSRVDPEAYGRIDHQNPQRVLRALEVFKITGRPISSFWAEGVHDGRGRLSAEAASQFPYRLLQYIVMPQDRTVLHDRIAHRFRGMLELGFQNEVEALYRRGDLHLDLPSMRSVGYRQMWQYLDGTLDYDNMVERGIIATRQLAKRQLTWLRGWPDATVLDTSIENSVRYATQVRERL
ncbi:tRNA (adenosine(37)-N6)-dimethylallyltransferase MiaA [Reinekea blandensis]|uniref:tRNA dimethylallyltransferase n=1 Tax=Reinekea blandensis MED297 TaxID=314283 RepID=A4BEB3_9GAMM|nr:tRNA (adenosine(37)-N6)-dimethylallyltransferase MiaA [Reinekea blandensis]EAR09591.1 tRNA delta(2)-isopentenylpyrophosphate transferase [Reinekea blandensis MED297]